MFFLWDNENVNFFPCKFCIVTSNKTLATSHSALARSLCALKPQSAPLKIKTYTYTCISSHLFMIKCIYLWYHPNTIYRPAWTITRTSKELRKSGIGNMLLKRPFTLWGAMGGRRRWGITFLSEYSAFKIHFS